MKLCKDCKHFYAPSYTPHSFCLNDGAAKDPVSGRAFASFERETIGNCGKDGKLFEQRIGMFKRLFSALAGGL